MSLTVKVISLFLFATFKFFWAVFLAIGYELHWLVAAFTLMLGGVVGVLIFIFIGEWIKKLYLKTFYSKSPKRFSRQNRWIIKVKQKGGLLGLAVLTPVLFSIPIGVLAAVAIGFGRRDIIIFMCSAVIFWAFFLLTVYHLTGWTFRW